MKQIEKKRLVQFVLLALLIYCCLQLAFKGINHFTTRTATIQQGILSGEEIDEKLYVLQGLEQSSRSCVFTIETRQALGVVVHNLTYPLDLRINGKPAPINSYAYYSFPVNEGKTTVELSGKGAGQTFFFVSEADAMRDHLELRFLINAFMLFLHLVVLIGCFIYLSIGKNKKVAVIFLIYVLSSIIKGINLGELSVLSTALGMNLYTYNVIDGITTAINNLLPIYVLLLLFEIRLKKIYMVLLSLFIIPFAVLSQDIFAQFQAGHVIISIMALSLTTLIIVCGYVKEKKAALPIMILRSIFLVFTSTYLTVIRNGSPISNLVFFFNYAYLGATLYFIGILGVVIAFYLRYNRDLVLKEKEYERVMLLKGLGHDLKHPVLTAKLNNQFLLEGDLKQAERESVQISLKALARLDKMIENINDYFNQQNTTATRDRMSLKQALKRIEDNHKNQTEHILIVKYAEEDCTININPMNFYRIIDNLTDNAFKFNNAEKIVTISYEVSDYQVLITLEDNGNGLDKNEIHKVFDIFYRGEENRSVEGLGIGLSVVKQLVEGSGGEIWVQSQKNAGTIFTIKFPIEEFMANG